MRWMMAVGMLLMAAAATAQDAPTLNTPKERQSYALGVDLANQLLKLYTDLDPVLIGQGLKDAFAGGKTLLTQDQVRAAVAELQAGMRLKQAQALGLGPAENKKAGEEFRAENRKKEGVVTLPSGLQYRILKAGDGRKPTADDTVVCHYRAAFVDGTEFYNSYQRNQPMTLAVKGVIKGWTEALQLMPVGSKWELVVPPQLAYGELGSGPVRPNATLIYEVELISIQDKP